MYLPGATIGSSPPKCIFAARDGRSTVILEYPNEHRRNSSSRCLSPRSTVPRPMSHGRCREHAVHLHAHNQHTMTTNANGTFEVKLAPQEPQENVGDPTIGRMSIDKEFHGDLEAASRGEMLAAGTD